MTKPYLYVARSTPGSPDISRQIPTDVGGFVRVALNYPDLKRTLEVWADGEGRWSLDSRPAPAHGGETYHVARGILAPVTSGTTSHDQIVRCYPTFAPVHLPALAPSRSTDSDDAYREREIRRVLDNGPWPGEDFYRLKITGESQTHALNVSPEQVAAIAEIVGTPRED
jgi:hypothetical protein